MITRPGLNPTAIRKFKSRDKGKTKESKIRGVVLKKMTKKIKVAIGNQSKNLKRRHADRTKKEYAKNNRG